MDPNPDSNPPRMQRIFNLTLAAVVGQVGCLTLVIILGAVFLGLWLDAHFQTRPVLTLVLVGISIPVSLLVMLAVVRGAVGRIKAQSPANPNKQKEVADIGSNTDS
jgi:ABC-type transport system involved in cytochrome c biogenesis permease subunit